PVAFRRRRHGRSVAGRLFGSDLLRGLGVAGGLRVLARPPAFTRRRRLDRGAVARRVRSRAAVLGSWAHRFSVLTIQGSLLSGQEVTGCVTAVRLSALDCRCVWLCICLAPHPVLRPPNASTSCPSRSIKICQERQRRIDVLLACC